MYAHYWRELTEVQRKSLAERLKTSTEYLRLVLSGHKKAGPLLAKKLDKETDGKVKKDQLRPDIYQ